MLSNPASSKLVLYSFQDIVTKSDAIAIGRIKDVKKFLFQENKAIVSIDQVVCGKLSAQELGVLFGRKNIFYAKEDTTFFENGGEYILFLKEDGTSYRLFGANKGYYPIQAGGKVHIDGEDLSLDQAIKKIKDTRY